MMKFSNSEMISSKIFVGAFLIGLMVVASVSPVRAQANSGVHTTTDDAPTPTNTGDGCDLKKLINFKARVGYNIPGPKSDYPSGGGPGTRSQGSPLDLGDPKANKVFGPHGKYKKLGKPRSATGKMGKGLDIYDGLEWARKSASVFKNHEKNALQIIAEKVKTTTKEICSKRNNMCKISLHEIDRRINEAGKRGSDAKKQGDQSAEKKSFDDYWKQSGQLKKSQKFNQGAECLGKARYIGITFSGLEGGPTWKRTVKTPKEKKLDELNRKMKEAIKRAREAKNNGDESGVEKAFEEYWDQVEKSQKIEKTRLGVGRKVDTRNANSASLLFKVDPRDDLAWLVRADYEITCSCSNKNIQFQRALKKSIRQYEPTPETDSNIGDGFLIDNPNDAKSRTAIQMRNRMYEAEITKPKPKPTTTTSTRKPSSTSTTTTTGEPTQTGDPVSEPSLPTFKPPPVTTEFKEFNCNANTGECVEITPK